MDMVRRVFLIFVLSAFGLSISEAAQVFQAPKAFVANSFNGEPPKPQVLWLTTKIQPTVNEILHHDYLKKRVRYWKILQRSVWILQEVGKEKLITFGIVIDQGKLQQINVLEYRESRGSEIRHAFFTDQFMGAKLQENTTLDRHIDGISGATLSVNAMIKMARLALYLDSLTHDE